MGAVVSLREFAVSGVFGPVVPGCTSPELEAVLGPPEATGGQSRRYRRPSIWKYGDAQFFFDWPRGLYMVHLDTFSVPGGTPGGWGGLVLDPWCVREGLPLGEFRAAAQAAGCDWQLRHEPQFGRDVAKLRSGIHVAFATGADEWSSPPGLYGLWRGWAVVETYSK